MLNPKCLLNCTPGKKRRDDRVEEERPEPQVRLQLGSGLRVDGGHKGTGGGRRRHVQCLGRRLRQGPGLEEGTSSDCEAHGDVVQLVR